MTYIRQVRFARLIVALLSFGGQATVLAETPPALAVSARSTSDVVDVARGGAGTGARVLTNLDLVADADLGALVSWSGARVRLHVLGNRGGHPNDLAGTLQGLDNIEVGRSRLEVYQAWIEQDVFAGRASVLLGMADLNADFYQNDSAGVLLAPAFGIGSELAATGPNGPSIFPSTALTARVRAALGSAGYAKVAVVNAKSGVLGDPGGVDLGMRDGALLIGEAGWTGRGKLAAGYWRYTKRQDDLRRTGPDGSPGRAVAQGAYLLIDQPVTASDAPGPSIDLFARIGVSDGATTPFRGGWQVGALVGKVFARRPDSQLSFGVNRGELSGRYRANAADARIRLSSAETGVEITYSDQLTSFLRVQPDLQYVRRPSGDSTMRDAVVVGLRIVLTASTTVAR